MYVLGGQTLVRFLVDQCVAGAKSKKKNENKSPAKKGGKNEIDPAQLAKGAGHILRVIAHKLTHSHGVLYPFLVELINSPKYYPAFVMIGTSYITATPHTSHPTPHIFTPPNTYILNHNINNFHFFIFSNCLTLSLSLSVCIYIYVCVWN